MDEPHLLAASRYVASNPVQARLSRRAEDWPWSSTRALLDPERSDGLTDIAPVLRCVQSFAGMLQAGEDLDLAAALRGSETTGRQVGSSACLDLIDAVFGRYPMSTMRETKHCHCNPGCSLSSG